MQQPKYVYNKLYTGAYIKDKIAHETKNFLLDDDGNRYIYLNEDGKIDPKKGKSLQYVIHVMNASNYKQGYFEVVGISKIYHGPNEVITTQPIFKGHRFNEIFDNFYDDHYLALTFKCEALYLPQPNKHIYMSFRNDKTSYQELDKHTLLINSASRWGQKLRLYAKNGDDEVIDQLINHINDWFVKPEDDNSFFDHYESEMPFCLISGRVSLELSMSNLIAYFLNRDKQLLNKFIESFLKIKLDNNETIIKIERELKNIDLLISTNKRVIVIENKIDSSINGVKSANYNQLSKYFEYVEKTYQGLIHHYFVLLPEYNHISSELINQCLHGDKYIIKTYKELYDGLIRDYQYLPSGKQASTYQTFLFNEFKENIKFLTLTQAGKEQYIAYMRIKQKLEKI